MTNKIGRNDICFCGSGKKYKKCCLNKNNSSRSNVADLQWANLRKLEGTVIDEHLMPYLMEELPENILQYAALDLLPEEFPESMDQELRDLFFHNFFIPKVLFNWIDEPGGDEIEGFNNEKTIAENYLLAHSDRLNSKQREFIKAMTKTYYSFYSILDVEPEKSMTVKDILLGTTHKIKEKLGTSQIKRGDVVFSRILSIEKQSIFIGMAPMIIHARYHNNIVDYRHILIDENNGEILNGQQLRNELMYELVDYFFNIVDDAFNTPPPELHNTDGDKLLFSKSYFKLSLPFEDALEKLLPMTLNNSMDSILKNAKYDSDGVIHKIEFPWQKQGNPKYKQLENTILGFITIQKNKLILDTNSEERTAEGIELLNKYMGDSISFQQTLLETPENKVKSLRKEEQPQGLDDETMNLPEVQEQFKEFVKKHWDEWLDIDIPALGNISPREASKTERGREKLEALLLEYERRDAQSSDNLLKVDIPYLKEKLSL